MTPAVGELVAGKYRVERVLGEGGMGIVLVAMHTALDQRVALKLLRSDAAHDAHLVARFAREARAAARIQSEHVARVLDVTTTSDGGPVLVMEYLEGSDLERLLAAEGALPIDLAADYVLQACEAIAEAHAAGIVHRDLKPGNIFLADRADGTRVIKVLDFGISKFVSSESQGARGAAVTHASAVFGSPLYMAPEQLASTHGVDARADIWSLVVVLFELVTGSPPFDGATVPLVTTRILTAPTPSLATRIDGAPAALDAVIQRGLEKRRDRRFQSVAELARALAPFAPPECASSVARISRVLRAAQPTSGEPEPTSIRPLSSTLRPPFLAAPITPSSWPLDPAPAARRRFWPVLALGCLATLAGAVALVAQTSSVSREGTSQASSAGPTTQRASEPLVLPPPTPVTPPDAGSRTTPPPRPVRIERSRPARPPPETSDTSAFGGRQ
jgi:serine/threonine-protein kinase